MRKINLACIYMVILLSFCLLLPISAGAIPCLGVAPGAPGSGGTYFGPEPTGDDLYQLVFADNFVGGTDGFVFTGGPLSVWYGDDSGKLDTRREIYLLTNSASASAAWTFGEQSFAEQILPGINSYKPTPFWGIQLPDVSGWTALTAGEFGTGDKKFLVITDEMNAPGFASGEWLFAAAFDIKPNPGLELYRTSPRTTSSTAPAPSAMILLGTGLIGLVGIRRKFKK